MNLQILDSSTVTIAKQRRPDIDVIQSATLLVIIV